MLLYHLFNLFFDIPHPAMMFRNHITCKQGLMVLSVNQSLMVKLPGILGGSPSALLLLMLLVVVAVQHVNIWVSVQSSSMRR